MPAGSGSRRAAGQSQNVVEQALRVRGVLNDYYRGRAARSDTEGAVAAIRNEPWFDQVFLPNRGDLPEDPKNTKWYVEMDYDPLDVLARVRVPMAFFFAETDPWVPVEESLANIRRVTQSHSAVTIRQVPHADHLMETGPPDSGGPTSEQYLQELLEWLRAL